MSLGGLHVIQNCSCFPPTIDLQSCATPWRFGLALQMLHARIRVTHQEIFKHWPDACHMQSPILEPRLPGSSSSCFMLLTHPEMLVLRSPWPLMGCVELLATQKQLWADPNSFGQPMHYGEPGQGLGAYLAPLWPLSMKVFIRSGCAAQPQRRERRMPATFANQRLAQACWFVFDWLMIGRMLTVFISLW